MNGKLITTLGSVATAAVSSACCWLPLLLIAGGMSATGIAAVFAKFRPLFVVAAILLLGMGYYFNYFHKERCAGGDACSHATPRMKRFSRGMLWISTAIVLSFTVFPAYVGALFDSSRTADATAGDLASWTLPVSGMTCTGCEATVVAALSGVDGVVLAKADYATATATVLYERVAPPDRAFVTLALERAGYTIGTTPSPRTTE